MVGVSVAWGATDSSLYPAKAVAQAYVLGAAEGDPVAVVAVATGPGVQRVRARFTGAGGVSDEMAPVYGWAVLAARIPGVVNSAGTPVGTLETLGSNGRTLGVLPLTVNSPVVAWFGYAPVCVLSAPPG